MDTESIYNELIDVGDKQNEMNAVVERNSRTLEEIKNIVTTPEVEEEKEPEEPVFQESIAVSNFPETQKVEVLNQETVDLSTVEGLLKNLVEAEADKDETATIDAIKKLTSIIAQDKSISNVAGILKEILNKEYPQFQLPPDLFDKDGRIRVEVDRTGGGGSSTLVDIEGERINPATATKQDEQISLETTLITLVGTLQELTARLSTLASMANSGAPALRVIPIASVSTAVTGAVTVASTSITNFGTGIPAKEMADDINNYTAIVANINNVTA